MACDRLRNNLISNGVLGALVLAAGAASVGYARGWRFPDRCLNMPPFSILQHINKGTLKVAW